MHRAAGPRLTCILNEGNRNALDIRQEGWQVLASRRYENLEVDRPVAIHDAVANPTRVVHGMAG